MLKVEVNDGGTKILAMGSAVELTTDVCVMIKEIYEQLKFNEAKEFFIESLQTFLDEELYKMSGEELAELNKKKLEELYKMSGEEIEKLNKKKLEEVEAKKKEEAEKKEQEKKDFEKDIKTMIDLMKKVLKKK